MYDAHLGLIGKCVVDLPISVNWTFLKFFFARWYAERLKQAKIDRKSISLQHGQFDPKFQVEGVKAVRDRMSATINH